MALVFFLCLFDFRRPLRIVHLDLLVLLSFGISQLYFNRGEIGVSVPLAYPPLIYLLCRMLWLGFRGGSGLRPTLGARWLALAAVLLIAFRVTINIADSGVIDVGYAGTIGADRIAHGERIYGEDVFPDDNRFGDTYGPANYYAYVPFELVMPWSGSWDELPASHGAAIAFDLAAAVGLAVCGMRLWPGRRGRELGAVLAIVVAFVPRRRTLPQIAALAAAVLIAIQLSVDHWFYLYIPWFFGALAIALLAISPSERRPLDEAVGG